MRGTVAKRIRRRVYGDNSFRQRRYEGRRNPDKIVVVNGAPTVRKTLVVHADETRKKYQRTKKEYANGKEK